MKRTLILVLVLILLAGAVVTVRAQTGAGYTLTWWTIDSGGSQKQAGGGYTLSATIGQPDAAAASGSNYTLSGGFWSPRISGSVAAFKILLPVLRR